MQKARTPGRARKGALVGSLFVGFVQTDIRAQEEECS